MTGMSGEELCSLPVSYFLIIYYFNCDMSQWCRQAVVIFFTNRNSQHKSYNSLVVQSLEM